MTVRRRRAAAAAAVVAAVMGFALAPPASASNDTYFERQWALQQIKAAQAWPTSTGAGITIGIVDTGVDMSHPDLAGKVLATANCVGQPCAPGGAQDDHGHGTIVSGIAAAVTNNAKGIAGVAPDATLVVAKVLDSHGEGRIDDINNGIRWVVDHGARVVNLSVGDPSLPGPNVVGTPLRFGIQYAWSRGAVPVLASGNYARGAGAPGSENYGNLDALVVGATDRSGTVPSYSSAVGTAKWGLVAPGGAGSGGADANVISTYPVALGPTGYASSAGTSMAVPHVAGAVALVMAEGLGANAAVSRILATLDKTACGPGCQGRLDAAAAVSPGAGIPSTPTPTSAPITVARATTTGPPATTSTSSTVPPRSVQADDPSVLAAPLPAGVPTGARRAPAENGRTGAVVFAAALVIGVGGATGGIGARRLRASGAGW